MYARLRSRPRTLLSLIVPMVMAPLFSTAAAQQPVQTQPREHVVRRGDTLWDLSRLFLMNPYLWPRIFEANRSVVEDPHWIYPGERLVIPGLADTVGVAVTVAPEVPTRAAGPAPRSRFYTERTAQPEERAGPTMEQQAMEQPYLVEPREWSAAAWLADTAGLAMRGRVARMADPTQVEDRLPSRLHPYDQVIIADVRGSTPAAGDSLLVVSIAGNVPGYGSKIVPVALVEVEEQMQGGGVVARVVHQYGEAIVGQLVIDRPQAPTLRRGTTRPVSDGPAGRLVAFLDEDPLKGAPDLGFVDLGGTDVNPGDVLIAYLPDLIAANGQPLRAGRIATLRVIRTADRTATVRVLSTLNTGLRDGLAVQVTQRAP